MIEKIDVANSNNGVGAISFDNGLTLTGKTTSTTAKELFLDGTTAEIKLLASKVYAFSIKVIATNSTGSVYAYGLISGMVETSTPAILGTVQWTELIVSTNDTYSATVTVGSAYELKVNVTGDSNTLNWKAVVSLVDISL